MRAARLSAKFPLHHYALTNSCIHLHGVVGDDYCFCSYDLCLCYPFFFLFFFFLYGRFTYFYRDTYLCLSHIHVCVCLCIPLSVYACVSLYVRMCVFMGICVCIVYACVYVCTHVNVRVYMEICVDVRIYVYIRKPMVLHGQFRDAFTHVAWLHARLSHSHFPTPFGFGRQKHSKRASSTEFRRGRSLNAPCTARREQLA